MKPNIGMDRDSEEAQQATRYDHAASEQDVNKEEES